MGKIQCWQLNLLPVSFPMDQLSIDLSAERKQFRDELLKRMTRTGNLHQVRNVLHGAYFCIAA